MTVVIGTKTDQIELAGVEWIILDKLDLEIHTDGQQAVIEEVKKMSDKLWTAAGVCMWFGLWGWFFWKIFEAVIA